MPLILMTGYGYDPGHNIVKCARRACPSTRCSASRSASTNFFRSVERVIQDAPKPVEQAS